MGIRTIRRLAALAGMLAALGGCYAYPYGYPYGGYGPYGPYYAGPIVAPVGVVGVYGPGYWGRGYGGGWRRY